MVPCIRKWTHRPFSYLQAPFGAGIRRTVLMVVPRSHDCYYKETEYLTPGSAFGDAGLTVHDFSEIQES